MVSLEWRLFVWRQVDVIVLLHLLCIKVIDAFKCQFQIDHTRHSFGLQRVVHICRINKCLEDNTGSDVRLLSYCCRSSGEEAILPNDGEREYSTLCLKYLKLPFL